MEEEFCFLCQEPTGRAGRYDDSLYDDDDNGPYCSECFERVSIERSLTDTVKERVADPKIVDVDLEDL